MTTTIEAMLAASIQGPQTPRTKPWPSVEARAGAGLDDVDEIARHGVAGRRHTRRVFFKRHLMRENDAAFVASAYLTILDRPPDPGGFAHALTALRDGTRSKESIIAGLLNSDEAKQVGIAMIDPSQVRAVFGATNTDVWDFVHAPRWLVRMLRR